MAKRLDTRCPLSIRMAGHGMVVEPDTAYIIPGGKHGEVMVEGGDVMIILHEGPKVNYVRPSVDLLMKSVARVFGERTIGTLLTGMGWDGAKGMKAIKDAGGTTIAQDEKTSAVFAMPKSAIDLGCVDRVLPLQDISDGIMTEILKMQEEKKVTKKIMVVDDDMGVVEIVSALLEKQGFEVSSALGGKECIAKIEEENPDILLLDVMMPDMGGWHVVRELKRRGVLDRLKIIMLTVVEKPSEEDADLSEYVHDYMTKPFEIEDLMESVNAISDL